MKTLKLNMTELSLLANGANREWFENRLWATTNGEKTVDQEYLKNLQETISVLTNDNDTRYGKRYDENCNMILDLPLEILRVLDSVAGSVQELICKFNHNETVDNLYDRIYWLVVKEENEQKR